MTRVELLALEPTAVHAARDCLEFNTTMDPDDDDDIFLIVIPTILLLTRIRSNRGFEFIRERILWARHAHALVQEAQFESFYRMSITSFNKLLKILSPKLQVNRAQSFRRTGGVEPLSAAGMLQCCLSWLAGGNWQLVRVVTGISKSSFYRIVRRVMAAINSATELALVFPVTAEQRKTAARAFATRSTRGVVAGCIGAIDGWLCLIRTPRKSECGKVDSFFSGHYQCQGLNVQACADHNCRFTAISVRAPGGMNDAVAFKRWALSKVLLKIQGPYYVVGDNAYSQSRVVMTPYNKAQVTGHPERDNYNFFLSQLRIRVEMAFGLLVNKWRILKSPLCVKLSLCPVVISACARLHNFCIDERSTDDDRSIQTMLREARQWNPDGAVSYDETVATEPQVFVDDLQASALGEIARNGLVQHIAENNLYRPNSNVDRRRREQALS